MGAKRGSDAEREMGYWYGSSSSESSRRPCPSSSACAMRAYPDVGGLFRGMLFFGIIRLCVKS